MVKFGTVGLLLIASPPVWGQPPGGFGRGGAMRSPAFLALDADHDGVISATEIANAAAALKSLDKNGDGKLTQDEVRPAMGGRGGRGGRGDEPGDTPAPTAEEMVAMLMAFDTNGDGQLTRDELPERMHGLFDRADTDKNVVLTADEIRVAARAAASPAGGGEGRGEGRGVGRGEGGRGEPSFMKMDPILAAIDTNGDGQLTADEVRVNFGPGRGRGQE